MDPTPTGLFTDRREPATRIQRRKARVYRTLAIGKGLARERAAYSYICMPRFWMYYKPIFSLGEGFFLCATNNWKTTEVGIPYRMSGPFSIYLRLLLALVVRVPTVRVVGTVTNLSRPYQAILIVSSARLQLSGQTRPDGHLATDQTRPDAPPWPAAMQKPMGS